MKSLKSLLQSSRLPVGSTQPPIKSVPKDQHLSMKYVKLTPSVTRKTATLYYMQSITLSVYTLYVN